jgi:hypothetical protein
MYEALYFSIISTLVLMLPRSTEAPRDLDRPVPPLRYTNRLRSTAAPTKLANSGCGANGRDLSSG